MVNILLTCPIYIIQLITNFFRDLTWIVLIASVLCLTIVDSIHYGSSMFEEFLLMFPGKILTLNILAVLSYCLKNVLSRIFVFGMIKVAFDWIGPSILMKPHINVQYCTRC